MTAEEQAERLKGQMALTISTTELFTQENLHLNIKQRIIVTTQDKAKIVIGDALARAHPPADWKTPLGLTLAIGSMFVVSDFKRVGEFTPDTWRAFFMFCGVLCLIWLVWASAKSIAHLWNHDKAKPTVEEIIDGLKLDGSGAEERKAGPSEPASSAKA